MKNKMRTCYTETINHIKHGVVKSYDIVHVKPDIMDFADTDVTLECIDLKIVIRPDTLVDPNYVDKRTIKIRFILSAIGINASDYISIYGRVNSLIEFMNKIEIDKISDIIGAKVGLIFKGVNAEDITLVRSDFGEHKLIHTYHALIHASNNIGINAFQYKYISNKYSDDELSNFDNDRLLRSMRSEDTNPMIATSLNGEIFEANNIINTKINGIDYKLNCYIDDRDGVDDMVLETIVYKNKIMGDPYNLVTNKMHRITVKRLIFVDTKLMLDDVENLKNRFSNFKDMKIITTRYQKKKVEELLMKSTHYSHIAKNRIFDNIK